MEERGKKETHGNICGRDPNGHALYHFRVENDTSAGDSKLVLTLWLLLVRGTGLQPRASRPQAGLLLTRARPASDRRAPLLALSLLPLSLPLGRCEHLLGLRLRLPREDPQGGQDLHLGAIGEI